MATILAVSSIEIWSTSASPIVASWYALCFLNGRDRTGGIECAFLAGDSALVREGFKRVLLTYVVSAA
jgi:hypothetical protein